MLVVFGVAALASGELEDAPVDVSEEVIVAEQRLSTALDRVHVTLRDRGFARVLRLGHRSWYLAPKLWKPWVMVHDEGFARVRGMSVVPLGVSSRPPVMLDAYGNPLPQLPNPPGTVWVNTMPQGRASRARSARLAAELEPALASVREARWGMARSARRVAIRDELVGIWLDGVAPDGTPLPTAMARRRALVARWCATTDTDAGAWARDQVLAFVDAEVQPSGHPFTEAEIEAANRGCPFADPFAPAPAR